MDNDDHMLQYIHRNHSNDMCHYLFLQNILNNILNFNKFILPNSASMILFKRFLSFYSGIF